MMEGTTGRGAIVVGASSGIGRELAILLARKGYSVAVTARRTELLEELAGHTPGIDLSRAMDVSEPEQAVSILCALVADMVSVELVVICAGTGFLNPELDWEKEVQTIDVNVTGFAAVAGAAMKHFLDQGRGHLVGITSIAALRGGLLTPAYNASKAFESSYLEALRLRAIQDGAKVTVTEIQPGLVDTAMAKGENLFWLAPPEKAARQIMRAIEQKKKRAYVTRRWRMIAWVFKLAPDRLIANLR
ncbi:MAG: SDR family NAD(P)-dependent oxidoreductase [Candidatus Geothermincolia bacterium]